MAKKTPKKKAAPKKPPAKKKTKKRRASVDAVIVASNLLIDAEQMHEENPLTFQLPPDEEYARIRVGLHVKVAAQGERFWVKVSKIIDETNFEGIVDNTLLFANVPFNFEDKIRFEKRHIYCVHPGA